MLITVKKIREVLFLFVIVFPFRYIGRDIEAYRICPRPMNAHFPGSTGGIRYGAGDYDL